MGICKKSTWKWASLFLFGAVLSGDLALAESSNFGTLTVASGSPTTPIVKKGHTGGSYSLATIASSDRQKNRCLGFADPTPDHILVLEDDVSQLNLQVNSGGSDTTLVVQGPDQKTIYCGDDTGASKDASVQATNWAKGSYKVWVGSFESGQKHKYTLTVKR